MLEDESDEAAYSEGLVPLLIGVTGHRDLVPDEVPAIRQVVRAFLEKLHREFPDRPLRILTPLAQGSDQLVARIARDLGIPIVVPLPMTRALYLSDFDSPESLQEFERLCATAEEVYELPLAPGCTEEQIAVPGPARNRQYAQLGVLLCAHCHVLLALWDGKPSSELGGTAQVIRFRFDDVMPGYAPTEVFNQQLLAEDENDLVYHVVVSRDRPDGKPVDGLAPLDCAWLINDEHKSRSPRLFDIYARILERTNLFNREARKYRHEILSNSYPLLDRSAAEAWPAGIRNINTLFCAADWLAIFYQRRMMSVLRLTHALAFVMGLMFIFYSDFEARRLYVLIFFVCFVAAVGIHSISRRRDWHSKYLEYRALAEGLRIQFYFAVAGVTPDKATKFSHDNFLQRQDAQLGWIRNVMRVAGMSSAFSPSARADGLELAVRQWVGDEQGEGQLAYYKKKIEQFKIRDGQVRVLSRLVNLSVVAVLVASIAVSSDDIRGRLFLFLGASLLTLSIRESFLFRVAEKELIKRYEFMYSIFKSAYRRIKDASTDEERRGILRILGESALDEHAQWVFLQRDRAVDANALLRGE